MTDQSQIFCEIGNALFGPHPDTWKDCLADALQVNIRTVQRWSAGTAEVPDGVLVEMADLLHQHEAHCMGLRHRATSGFLRGIGSRPDHDFPEGAADAIAYLLGLVEKETSGG